MAYTPNTIVRLLSVPIDESQTNQIRFPSRSTQRLYFETTMKFAYTNFTFQRKDSVIRINANIDTLWECNYVMYDNLQFTGRWIYAFIMNKEYINDTVTALHIKTDVYQTWMQDCSLKESFVIREHITTDTIGANVQEEGLEIGDLVLNGTNSFAGMGDMDIIIASVTSSEGTTAPGDIYNNIYSGCYLYGTTDPDKVGNFIATMEGIGKSASILSIFMVPHLFTECTSTLTLLNPANLNNNVNVAGPSRPGTLDGYTPRNQKLKTFPYSFLYAHNSSGQSAIFKWELHNGTPAFLIFGSVGPNAVYKMIPMDLLSAGLSQPDYDQGITLAGFPVCAWNSNVYSNWIAQNTGSVVIGLAGGALTLGAGLAAANPMAIAGGALAIGGSLASISSKVMQPPQANGSVNSPNANCSNNWNDFILAPKSIRAGYARILDDFFDMYGYKTNAVKVPNVSGRPYWNYVKTAETNLTGPAPSDDMKELKGIYEKGVTLWHDADNIGNYALNNH